VLLQKRELYEREGIFPPSMVEYVSKMLMAEKDEDLNKRFAELPAEDRLHATRQIMHKDLHRH
jgi:glutamine synthetase